MKPRFASALLAFFFVSCATPIIKPTGVQVIQLGVPLSVVSTGRENSKAQLEKPYVLLISIDGYRYDYNTKYSPPNLSRIQKEGASAKSLVPVFPSKTFPNHYSIATGLYPENHGIVANSFYDFSRSNGDQFYNRKAIPEGTWYGGWPLWSVAEKNKMLSAVFFWPGSEAKIQDEYASYYLKYDEKIPNSRRVDQVIEWLKLPAEKRPHFLMLYFSDVDSAGHAFGPISPETKNAVLKVDSEIGVLFQKLKELPIPVNVIIVSDHGMTHTEPKKTVYLEKYLDLKTVVVGEMGPLMSIYRGTSTSEKMKKIYQVLKKHESHYKVFWRSQMPKHLHYSTNLRAGEIIVLADAPYSVGIHNDWFKVPLGSHGYDPSINQDMHGVFFAEGPDIKNIKLGSVSNLSVYPWILSMLKLKLPATIDATEGELGKLTIQKE